MEDGGNTGDGEPPLEGGGNIDDGDGGEKGYGVVTNFLVATILSVFGHNTVIYKFYPF